VLRTLAEYYPQVLEATRYFFDEASPDAVTRAREALGDFSDRVTFGRRADFESVEPWIFFSNELLDAFPVHRLVSDGEFYVTLDEAGNFAWTTGKFSSPLLKKYAKKLSPGQIIEVNLAIDDWLASIVAKMKRGYVITVDYGAEEDELYDPSLRPQGTLRGFSGHGFVDDVLSAPGEYDITANVNWTQVMAAAERLGLRVVEFESQNRFLLRSGLLESLVRSLKGIENKADQARLTTGARDMILPGGMASSFQVLVLKREET
jgi:SAM-dependent MidA family methyltransferase